jgi:hypothetical protein
MNNKATIKVEQRNLMQLWLPVLLVVVAFDDYP